jgi:uncharacterized protein involved in outer membrane biogenesis
LRLTLWSLVALVVIGAGLVFVVPLFISAENVRNKLFAEIESATGYRLTVIGPLHISAFPSLELVAEDVGVAHNAGADDAVELATAKELRFSLALAPLLSGKVQVTEIASGCRNQPRRTELQQQLNRRERGLANHRPPPCSRASASTASASRTAR